MADLVWIITGIILLGAIIAGGISLFVKRRKLVSDRSISDWTRDLDKKESSKYMLTNYNIYFSEKIANLYKPILYPNVFNDAPEGLYYRIVGNNLGDYCIQFFYYWKVQNCTLPIMSHVYDYEAIFVYLKESDAKPNKIVNGGLGGPECEFHKNEIRIRQGKSEEIEHHITGQLSEAPYYPFADKDSREITICVKNYSLYGEDLQFENMHPKFAIAECSHVYSGASELLQGKPFDPPLRELDDEILDEWYFEHFKAQNEMPFGHDVADPFTEPYIKYRNARKYLPQPSV